MLPPVINIPPAMVLKLIGSFNIIYDINIVSGTLSLSIGQRVKHHHFVKL